MKKELLLEMEFTEPLFGHQENLIAFTKHGRFYIGAMRTDGTGEIINRKLLSRGTLMVAKW